MIVVAVVVLLARRAISEWLGPDDEPDADECPLGAPTLEPTPEHQYS